MLRNELRSSNGSKNENHSFKLLRRLCGRKNTNKTEWDRLSQPRNTTTITAFTDMPSKQNLRIRFQNDASAKEILLHAECGLLKCKQDKYKLLEGW